ncbi:hypothetical protein OU415_06470 [Saccharopolyspora sp. WRP15-2]|uniref:Uncharacterized protein n=1 Tax=Saccharopolyspora oryzae TaxID=2997343 RepID=A0ABT4UTN4_9PSEU|nr:hypothetical protein [Saccharopolyspora oryzae]MDA3625070.1 hypothetical protein [Saccharopolyspora oryzae]
MPALLAMLICLVLGAGGGALTAFLIVKSKLGAQAQPMATPQQGFAQQPQQYPPQPGYGQPPQGFPQQPPQQGFGQPPYPPQ